MLARRAAHRDEVRSRLEPPLGCPVVAVGNLVVGGAGKTPTTIALVQALHSAGLKVGVVSRGWGRRTDAVCAVGFDADPASVGDEPLLIRRRTGAPVFVGRDRLAAARSLLGQHPAIDVIVADDALQHRRLPRRIDVVVFDERGIGNGRLMPVGPLRQPLTAEPGDGRVVLYNHAHPTTPWAGHCATRRLAGAWPLERWWIGDPGPPVALSQLRGRRLLAMAGIAVPERFFAGLEAEGLTIERLPLDDHHSYLSLPGSDEDMDLITTEKDATKLRPFAHGRRRVWVVGLDLMLPQAFVDEVLQRLRRPDPT